MTQGPCGDDAGGVPKRQPGFLTKQVVTPVRQSGPALFQLALVVCFALVVWKFMVLYTDCESPIVVVLSGSMEPAFFRGDLLLLSKPSSNEGYQVGDIVVFKANKKPIPIVHRVTQIFHDEQGGLKMLTKGDNNQRDDRRSYIYGENQAWVTPQEVVGTVQGYIPSVGYVTIAIYEDPIVGAVTIAALLVLILLTAL